MNILVVGSGGREHAIVWKLKQSPKANRIYCAPGNAGTAEIAENIPIAADQVDALLEFAMAKKINMTVVGPEVPLVLGIADKFEQYGLKVFGPKKNGAILEGSKVYAKEFMLKYDIPTAPFAVFNNRNSAREFISLRTDFPVVVKVDGLAAGKGVLICEDKGEAYDAVDLIMKDKAFGSAGDKIVIEDFISGTEMSVLTFVSGKTIAPMVTAKDYKRIGEGDQGLNTGGMGAISPNPLFDERIEELCRERVFLPTLIGLQREEIDFRGVLYFGLMLTRNNVYVLEYNVRFGDPETQVVLPRMESDLLAVIKAVVNGNLDKEKIDWEKQAAATVVLASGGYPGAYQKGLPVSGLGAVENATVFHAGTKKIKDDIVTNGGRVLAVTAKGKTVDKALKAGYKELKKIHFDKMYYRKDIGS